MEEDEGDEENAEDEEEIEGGDGNASLSVASQSVTGNSQKGPKQMTLFGMKQKPKDPKTLNSFDIMMRK